MKSKEPLWKSVPIVVVSLRLTAFIQRRRGFIPAIFTVSANQYLNLQRNFHPNTGNQNASCTGNTVFAACRPTGRIGKNTLLINDKLGNMMQIGALLLNVKLEGDPIAAYEACKLDCRLCIQVCPQSALDGITVNQQACRLLSNHRNERGFIAQLSQLA